MKKAMIAGLSLLASWAGMERALRWKNEHALT
jgi:hypothetical protein